MEDVSGGAVGIEVLSESSARRAGATVHLLGGTSLDVVQGTGVAGNRIEAAYDQPGRYASLTDAAGKVAFINPLAVTYIEQPEARESSEGYLGARARKVRAKVHFSDGSSLEVVQGISIVNKRFEESRASAGLFASLTRGSGMPAFVSRLAPTHITHITPDSL
jgi:hypothetical protein